MDGLQDHLVGVSSEESRQHDKLYVQAKTTMGGAPRKYDCIQISKVLFTTK